MGDGPRTLAEVAKFLRVPQGTVRFFIRTGALAAISLPGGHTLVERSALEDFIERHRQPARPKEVDHEPELVTERGVE